MKFGRMLKSKTARHLDRRQKDGKK